VFCQNIGFAILARVQHRPVVSIVTPSYNHGRFIRTTIESVLAQDYPHIEYIVMDGGSTDETASVVQDYASRLQFISEPDRGQSHAINKGFRQSRGSILFWLNSDDTILPGAVRRAVDALEENPRAGAVYGEGYLIDRDGRTTQRFPCTEPFNLWKLVYLSDYILQQTAYFRRAVLDEVGYVREDLHYAMDWDLLIRIGKRYPLHYIPEYMGCLREYPEAKSFAGGARRIREITAVLREHTGMKYPPGAIIYFLAAYQEIWSRALASKLPRFAAARLEVAIRMACDLAIGRHVHRAQGWYGDSWAGPRMRYMLPAGGSGTLFLSGRIPKFLLGRQTLTIRRGRELIARREFRPGDFIWRVAFSSSAEPISLEIRASRSFNPLLRGETGDRRRLAYLLYSASAKYHQPAAEFSSAPLENDVAT
jgi:glycosyltransferase involved in cell wall biosynthesis